MAAARYFLQKFLHRNIHELQPENFLRPHIVYVAADKPVGRTADYPEAFSFKDAARIHGTYEMPCTPLPGNGS